MADERLQIIDGFYRMVCDLGDRFGMGKTEHTWLQTRQGSVIDISPVGVIGGPLIFAHRDPDIGGDYHFASHQFQPGGIEDVIARILVSQSYSDSYKPVRDLFVEAIRLATADLG